MEIIWHRIQWKTFMPVINKPTSHRINAVFFRKTKSSLADLTLNSKQNCCGQEVILIELNMYPAIKIIVTRVHHSLTKYQKKERFLLERISGQYKRKTARQANKPCLHLHTQFHPQNHFGQIWAKVASVYYELSDINDLFGETEATCVLTINFIPDRF